MPDEGSKGPRPAPPEKTRSQRDAAESGLEDVRKIVREESTKALAQAMDGFEGRIEQGMKKALDTVVGSFDGRLTELEKSVAFIERLLEEEYPDADVVEDGS